MAPRRCRRIHRLRNTVSARALQREERHTRPAAGLRGGCMMTAPDSSLAAEDGVNRKSTSPTRMAPVRCGGVALSAAAAFCMVALAAPVHGDTGEVVAAADAVADNRSQEGA